MGEYRKSIGKFGEELAVKYIMAKGYKIVEINPRTGRYEIDIVAKNKENLLVFVEVKTRTSAFGEAEDSMINRKTKKLKIAIMRYLAKNKLSPYFFRLDLISINLNKIKKTAKIKHYKDIF